MNIVMMNVADLVPHPGNAKMHPPEQVKAIAESIKNFGWDQPIVVNPSNVIIKGHGRRLAAIELGMKTVPVVISKNTDQHIDRLNRVLDNALTSQEYDPVLLHQDLKNLMEIDPKLVEKASFTVDTIPQINELVARGDASLFSLLTKHKCPSCSYKW